jgi:hypothetical protein
MSLLVGSIILSNVLAGGVICIGLEDEAFDAIWQIFGIHYLGQ